MNLPEEWTMVTPLSKTLAALVFILFPFLGFFLGIQYQRSIRSDMPLPIPLITPLPSRVIPQAPTPSEPYKISVTKGPIPSIPSPYPIITLADRREVVDGQVIVGFSDTISESGRQEILDQAKQNGVLPGTTILPVGQSAVLIDISQTKSIETAIEIYKQIPGVRYAEPNGIAHTMENR